MNPLFLSIICLINLQTSDDQCFEAQFESRAYIDCVDDPTSPPVGYAEGGSGVIFWGSRFGEEFTPNGSAQYEWRGVQATGNGFGKLMLGIDPDRIFSDGGERECRSGFLG